MSAEYVVKMETLRRNREELSARRHEIERQLALREATAVEYSAIALQSCKQKWKGLRAAAIASKARNDAFLREAHQVQRKASEATLRCKQGLRPSYNQLEQEKEVYFRKVEELYPAWQEKRRVMRLQRLRELEDKKQSIEKRRSLAKQTFDTDQELDGLLRQTSHEIELAENLEKNEAYAREMIRRQSTANAKQLDQSIRNHARGARIYMEKHVEPLCQTTEGVPEDIEDKLFETFSPRGTLGVLRGSTSSVSFVESASHKMHQTVRPLKIVVPHAYANDENLIVEDKTQVQHFPSVSRSQQLNHHATSDRSEAITVPATEKECTEKLEWEEEPNIGVIIKSEASRLPVVHQSGEGFNTKGTLDITNANTSVSEQILPERTTSQVVTQANLTTRRQGEECIDQSKWQSNDNFPDHNPLASDSLSPSRNVFVNECLSPLEDKHPTSTCDTSEPSLERIEPPSEVKVLENTSFEAEPVVRSNTAAGTEAVQGLATTRIQENKDDTFTAAFDTAPTQEIDGSAQISDVSGISPHDVDNYDSVEPLSISLQTAQDTQLRDNDIITHSETFAALDSKLNEHERSPDKVFSAHATGSACDREQPSPGMQPAPQLETIPVDLTLRLVNSFDSNASSSLNASTGWLLDSSRILDGEILGTQDETSDGVSRSVSSDAKEENSSSGDHAPSNSPQPREQSSSLIVQVTQEYVNPSHKDETVSTSNSVKTQDQTGDSGCSAEIESTSAIFGNSFAFASGESIRELESRVEHDTLNESTSIRSATELQSTETAKLKNKPTKLIEQNPIQNERIDQDDAEQGIEDGEEVSLGLKLSMPERLKALKALVHRVEGAAMEGEQLNGSLDSGSSIDTKRELLRMAVAGRQAQINFFGSDVCFELVVALARGLGSVLFPPKAFDGIMSDNKMKKLHSNSKEKELDIWKILSGHIKQLHALNAIPIDTLVPIFVDAFLHHDPLNDRSQRKLREFLSSLCGGSHYVTKPASVASSPTATQSPRLQETTSPLSSPDRTSAAPTVVPSLLQTALLQQSGSTTQIKMFGLSSASANKSSTDDILKDMASSPSRLSQKLMRGGNIGDYSEFEEEDEVDLENLIGGKGPATGLSGAFSTGRPSQTTVKPGRGVSGSSVSRMPASICEDRDDFDVDF